MRGMDNMLKLEAWVLNEKLIIIIYNVRRGKMKLIRPTIDYMYIVNEAESRNGTMYYLQNKLILVRLY